MTEFCHLKKTLKYFVVTFNLSFKIKLKPVRDCVFFAFDPCLIVPAMSLLAIIVFSDSQVLIIKRIYELRHRKLSIS